MTTLLKSLRIPKWIWERPAVTWFSIKVTGVKIQWIQIIMLWENWTFKIFKLISADFP